MTKPSRVRRCRIGSRLVALVVGCLVALMSPAAWTEEDELVDIFGNLGTAEQYDEEVANEAARAKQAEGHGSVVGQVFDGESGATLVGVTIILQAATAPSDEAASQFVATSGGGGGFEFASVPPGDYKLSFVKSGYRTAEIQNVTVAEGSITRNDFPMPRVAAAAGDEILDLDAFVVDASVVGDMMDALDLRLESDGLLNVMSAEDFSKFAAGDVAEALKRVSGVNIVEGQFAIIRGLEDRYSSTLYNGAVIPSPDPDRQSVQLDLFPSEVLANTIVAKSFSAELPSNSSGGSIDMVTHDYPESFEIELSVGAKVNDLAYDEFIEFRDGNAAGITKDELDAVGGDLGLSAGGRRTVLGRELRAKAVASWSVDRKAQEGWEEEREPAPGNPNRRREKVGDLAFGELSLSEGRFDFYDSEDEETFIGYLGLGFDIDEAGDHKIDGSFFHVEKEKQKVLTDFDGYFPDFMEAGVGVDGYPALFDIYVNRDEVQYSQFDTRATRNSWIGGNRALREFDDAPPNKPAWWSNFREYRSKLEERELEIFQLNGAHTLAFLDDVQIDWAANRATTEQSSELRGLKVYYDPLVNPDWTDPASRPDPPITIDDLGEGVYRVNDEIRFSTTAVEEKQWFARVDAEYENDSWFEDLVLKFTSGFWYEKAKRTVDAEYLESPRADSLGFFFEADSPTALSDAAYGGLLRTPEGDFSGMRETENESKREILAGHVGLKATFVEHIDLFGNVRIESLQLTSNNDPFTDETLFGVNRLFPNQYVLFDRLDNNLRGEQTPFWQPEDAIFNDQILGLGFEADVDCPLIRDPEFQCVDFASDEALRDLVNGEIDENHVLPSVGFAIRPLEGLSFRGVYSQTVARPSFREMGYYVTEDDSGDLIIGNPLLQLSDVTSYDGRIEYTYGDNGDLIAFSIFEKKIKKPIERIVLRDPLNAEDTSGALFRTYFNNPNDSRLWGIEVEAQKTLDFLDFLPIPGIGFLEYFSVGGNYTKIHAKVDRVPEERRRAARFFLVPENFDPGREILYSELSKSRRLFGQPEWIANANISFDQPDWGTRLTLAWFAISDVLDAAGSSQVDPSGTIGALTLDQYIDSFEQLDLIASQRFELEALGTEVTFKFSAKNLTNSVRKEVYDPEQTSEKIAFRRYKVGRTFKFGVTVTGF